MPAALQVGQYFLVRGTDTMFFYMTEDIKNIMETLI